MAFANIAGRAGFVLELDKSQLDRGLADAERQFNQSTSRIAASASNAGSAGTRPLDGLLADVRRSRAEADALGQRLQQLPAESVAGRFAGLGAVLGRAGLYGIGISTAIQTSRELQDQLAVTGREAFTTEGKLRNMGAALVQGNLIGGIKALSAAPKTIDDLGISAQQASGRLEALRKVATGQAAVLREMGRAGENNAGATEKSKQALQEYNAVVKAAGTSNQVFASQLLEQGRAWQELDRQMRGVFNTAQGFRGPGGELIVGGGFSGLRPGPQRVPAGQSILGPGAVVDTTPESNPRDRAVGNLRLKLAAARRSDDLQTEKSIQAQIVGIYSQRLEHTKLTGAKLLELRQQLSAELDTLDAIQDRINADAAARTDARRRAEEAAAAERLRKQKEAAAAAKRTAEAERREIERNVNAVESALNRFTGPYANTRSGFAPGGVSIAEANRRVRAAAAAQTDDAARMRQELGAVLRDLMAWQTDFLRNGSNVMGGNLGTHVLEELTRNQIATVRQGFEQQRFNRRLADEAVFA